ncbi:hypothetical protein Ahy_B01g056148 [Arachis hypogaea]|uniref:Enolase C-terminal TIM barrel domain-containing protein n=1 Tax=Arachis hypogaea TaxID=3818 RepID=A0A445AY21_ARAHY|nr:hypothetical protein Ahy_B01g056148 [Arachis hypogaea]
MLINTTLRINRHKLVGDDLLMSNAKRIEKAVLGYVCNALLLKKLRMLTCNHLVSPDRYNDRVEEHLRITGFYHVSQIGIVQYQKALFSLPLFLGSSPLQDHSLAASVQFNPVPAVESALVPRLLQAACACRSSSAQLVFAIASLQLVESSDSSRCHSSAARLFCVTATPSSRLCRSLLLRAASQSEILCAPSALRPPNRALDEPPRCFLCIGIDPRPVVRASPGPETRLS